MDEKVRTHLTIYCAMVALTNSPRILPHANCFGPVLDHVPAAVPRGGTQAS